LRTARDVAHERQVAGGGKQCGMSHWGSSGIRYLASKISARETLVL